MPGIFDCKGFELVNFKDALVGGQILIWLDLELLYLDINYWYD